MVSKIAAVSTWCLVVLPSTTSWVIPTPSSRLLSTSITKMSAKPRRLDDNVNGVLYVNDQCINCGACGEFAPSNFHRSGSFHVVKKQPEDIEEMLESRAALAACPVAAIRLETKADKSHAATDKSRSVPWSAEDEELATKLSLSSKSGLPKPFPKPLLGNVPDVYWLGHHNEHSFGAVPYLMRTSIGGRTIWIMLDTPRFGKSATDAITSLTGPTGPDYLLMTHVDDTADHDKWANHFDTMKQIFHAGDLGKHNWIGDRTLEDVDILLSAVSSNGLVAYTLDGTVLENWESTSVEDHSVIIFHTPGHSPGSISLYKRPQGDDVGILFTGDTYAYTTRDGGHMSGFPRYGNNLRQQAETLKHLLELDWHIVAPGHGHTRDYRNDKDYKATQKAEMDEALEELFVSRRYW